MLIGALALSGSPTTGCLRINCNEFNKICCWESGLLTQQRINCRRFKSFAQHGIDYSGRPGSNVSRAVEQSNNDLDETGNSEKT
jgi:hypothetical protein